jgi:hypothetical protein
MDQHVCTITLVVNAGYLERPYGDHDDNINGRFIGRNRSTAAQQLFGELRESAAK